MTSAAEAVAAKAALRRQLTASRRALSRADIAVARAAVAAHVLRRVATDGAAGHAWRTVFAYVPLATEPGSQELLDALLDGGAAVHVPVLRPDLDLDWRPWPDPRSAGPDRPPQTDQALGPDQSLGLDAISSATVVVVPALAVDRSGMRLGRGGGSYDRALSRVPAGVPVVALLHRGELLDRVPAEPWDRAVTAVVDPDGWLDLPTPAPGR